MKRWTRALAVGMTLGMTLTACGPGDDGGGAGQAAANLPQASIVAPIEGMTCASGAATPTGDPIVVGGSLSLTGALAPTAAVHNGVAGLVVDWVNRCGGVKGRPLRWKVLDDQSTPAQAASNYERLINEKADLVMGPYGGANTLAGAGPVGRAGYAYPTHTNGAPDQLIGDFHFPSWQFGGGVGADRIFATAGEELWDALKSGGDPPESIFYATAKFPTTLALTAATRKVAEANGAKTADSVQYDLGTTDFSSIALRISAADPDFIYFGALGADVTNLYDAFAAINYTPRGIYAALPSPASIAGLGSEADGLLTLSLYENHAPLADTGVARYFAQEYSKIAARDKLFPLVETQAAASFGAWQILLTAVQNAGVDNKAIIEWLNENKVPTLAGEVSFDGYNNYGVDLNRVTQIQDEKRVIVWPKEFAGGRLRSTP